MEPVEKIEQKSCLLDFELGLAAILLHNPVTLPLKLSSKAMEGVTCDFCHTISGDEHFGKDISTGAYKYPRKGETAIKYGAHANANTTNHLSKESKFLQSSEFCGICHKFNHPFSGAAMQDTYEEWKSGPYSKSAKRGGKRCQDCHIWDRSPGSRWSPDHALERRTIWR
jgi:hypothetical protein